MVLGLTPGAWLMIAIAALLVAFPLAAVSYRLTEAYTALEERMWRALARDAATFGEPTREQVEEVWRREEPVVEAAVEDLRRRGYVR